MLKEVLKIHKEDKRDGGVLKGLGALTRATKVD